MTPEAVLEAADAQRFDANAHPVAWPLALAGDKAYRADWIDTYLVELGIARGIEPVLVNARQLHNVPGRKTAVQERQWLQTLHSHGLLRGSFRPADAIVQLRALQRQQANFVEQRTRCVQRSKTALGARFRRIARHKGAAVAVFAIARKLAQLVYRMLRYGHDYIDIGQSAYELRYQARRLAGPSQAAKSLGYILTPAHTPDASTPAPTTAMA